MRDSARVSPVRLSKLLWLPVALGMVALAWVFGLPHMLWNYEYVGRSEPRYLTSCDYLGPYAQRIVPHDGTCPFIAFLTPVKGETP